MTRSPEELEPTSLQQHWKKTKTKSKGVKMLEKIAYLLDEEDNLERVGFIQVRLVGPKEKKRSPKPQRKKDGDKNLRFSCCDLEVHNGLRKSRVA